MAYIEMKHCYKRYQVGDTDIVANRDVNFEIEKGELVIILGASGAGKSTVLNLLGGMDTKLMVPILQTIVPTSVPITAAMMSALFFSFII